MVREADGWSRRDFLKTAGGAAFLGGAWISGLSGLAAAVTGAPKTPLSKP